ncbi:uncharacterized protein LOC143634746 [Bidens hawaiensis]|uniref:uncharacterized protein LOC143634746 n=1 Tax=Bidens hawaiensis TaxID=980011 RepID=UPI00404BA2A8
MNFLSLNLCGFGGGGGGYKASWVRDLVGSEKVDVGVFQETKLEIVTRELLAKFWVKGNFEFEYVASSGLSGGLCCVWDPRVFGVLDCIKDRNFLFLKGFMKGEGSLLNIVNVYAPQGAMSKRMLWDRLSDLVGGGDGFWVVCGDFNVVREASERRNSVFKGGCSRSFNGFIRKLFLGSLRCVISACLRALSTCISDHRPIILSCKEVNFGPRPFRVLNSWTCRAGFEDVVNMAVDSFVFEGSSDLRLLAKLKWLRIHIKRWRDEMVVKEEEEKKVVREEMAILEECLEERDLEEDEVWTLARCKAVLKEHEGLKLQDLIQRSRLKWARDGDDNTKFFHSMVNCRKASNGIPGLNVNGVLSEEDSGFLVERFKTSEIKAAVFECGSDKAPGPDGFNFFFIKKFWGVFEEDFYAVFTDFFEDGKINIGCNSSFITLIPKKKDPLSLNDYRPISLVGVIAKVISKLLANRMKVVLDSVISDQQSAFIRGKSIIDGPLVINEVVSWCKLKKKKCFFLKIDFEKAYDNVNWDFVISILHQMNFPDRWCQWVRGLLSSARSAVLVNGSPTYEFKCSKGMR